MDEECDDADVPASRGELGIAEDMLMNGSDKNIDGVSPCSPMIPVF